MLRGLSIDLVYKSINISAIMAPITPKSMLSGIVTKSINPIIRSMIDKPAVRYIVSSLVVGDDISCLSLIRGYDTNPALITNVKIMHTKKMRNKDFTSCVAIPTRKSMTDTSRMCSSKLATPK